MTILCFPHLGILRLAIGREIVPPEWSGRAVKWAIDGEGRVWLQLPAFPSRTVQEKLVHLGVSWQKELPPLRFSQSQSWAEILPLERNPKPIDHTVVLVSVKATRIAELLRSRYFFDGNFRIIYDDYTNRSVWGLLSPVPQSFIELGQSRGDWRVYVEQAERRWVEWGYQHPLIQHISPPQHGICILDASGQIRRLRVVPNNSGSVSVLPLELKRSASVPGGNPHSVHAVRHVICLPLRWSTPGEEKRDPTLWYIPGEMPTQFWQRCQEVDEETLGRIHVAFIQTRHARGLIIWDKSGSATLLSRLPKGAVPYVVDPEIPQLFWPAGWQWRPFLGLPERMRLAGVHVDCLTWVEKCLDGTSRCHRVATGDFHSLASVVEYIAPSVVAVRVADEEGIGETLTWSVNEPNRSGSLEKRSATSTLLPPRIAIATQRLTAQPTNPTKDSSTIWQRFWNLIGRHWWQSLGTSWGKSRHRGRQQSAPRVSSASAESKSSSQEGTESVSAPILHRDVLASEPAAWGTEGSVQQPELCQRLLTVKEPEQMAHLDECWAELARWQQLSGRGHDAALCWLMAVWESGADNIQRWCEQWWLAELRLARASAESVRSPEFWQQRLTDGSVGRLAAASLVRLAIEREEKVEVRHLLPQLIPLLEKQAGELPLRAVWLAACAASQLCEGNILLLARWLDGLLKRLTQHGHTLDLDVPSFLRFVGNSEPEHLTASCTWLIRQRHQMLSWVLRHPVGPLRVEGLDGETTVTSQVASLLWAWGLAAVGERRRAEEWWNSLPASCERLDDETAAALQCVGAIVRWRMQEVWDGRPSQPEFPSDWRTQRHNLSSAARYAVDRLCEYSRIIDPFRLSRPLRCWELAPLRADDPLGERLVLLLERPDVDGVTSEADELLRMCERAGDGFSTCRILVALCELASLFPPEILERLVKLVPTVWESLPAYWPEKEGRQNIGLTHLRREEVQCRMLENLARAMIRWPENVAGPYLAELWRQWQYLLPAVVSVMGDVIPLLANVFRRFHLQQELERLAAHCREAQSLETCWNWEHRLAAATVWAALEETDMSDPIMDAARDHLFLPAHGSVTELSAREYTQLAYGYATALAFFPSRRRLGRYEELFQRLRPVYVHGSTNRFWTLQPLRLVDIVVQGVIGEVYRLAPQVQQWLALQDMRFRCRVYQDVHQRLYGWEKEKASLVQ
jgi:hypothetical protein